MSDQNRDERLQIMLTPDELSALDDWRFARRMPSRAAAVRELLRLGLAAEGIDLARAGRRSKDFGVTEGSSGRKVGNGHDGSGRQANGNGHDGSARRANGDGHDEA